MARKLTIHFHDMFSQEIQALVDSALALSWAIWGESFQLMVNTYQFLYIHKLTHYHYRYYW